MLNIATNGLEIWLLQDDCTIYSTKPRTDLVGNIIQARAYWVNRDTLAWLGAEPNDTYQLYYSPDAGITDVATSGVEGDGKSIPLTVDPNGLSQTIIDKFPFLKGATAFKIAQSQLGQVPSLLKDQLVLVKFNGAQAVDATSLQLPGVLDDLFYFDSGSVPILRTTLFDSVCGRQRLKRFSSLSMTIPMEPFRGSIR